MRKMERLRIIVGYGLLFLGIFPAAILAAIGAIFMGFGLLFMLPAMFTLPPQEMTFGARSVQTCVGSFTKREENNVKDT